MRGRVNALEGREEIGYWREELKPPVEKHTAFQAGNLADLCSVSRGSGESVSRKSLFWCKPTTLRV